MPTSSCAASAGLEPQVAHPGAAAVVFVVPRCTESSQDADDDALLGRRPHRRAGRVDALQHHGHLVRRQPMLPRGQPAAGRVQAAAVLLVGGEGAPLRTLPPDVLLRRLHARRLLPLHAQPRPAAPAPPPRGGPVGLGGASRRQERQGRSSSGRGSRGRDYSSN